MPLSDLELYAYVREIANECTHCLASIGLVRRNVSTKAQLDVEIAALFASGTPRGDAKLEKLLLRDRQIYDRIFFYAHAALSHAGNVSKILWPPLNTAQARGIEVQTALAVGQGLLIANRARRNDLEHMDERLDSWLDNLRQRGDPPVMIDMNLNPAHNGFDAFRHLNPTTLVYSFGGQSIDLKALRLEVQTLQRTTEGWMEAHGFRR